MSEQNSNDLEVASQGLCQGIKLEQLVSIASINSNMDRIQTLHLSNTGVLPYQPVYLHNIMWK
jgi:hypothetical protein